MNEQKPASEILAQGAFARMDEMRGILKKNGIGAELVAPPGASGGS